MALFFKRRIYVRLSPEAQELLEIYKLSPEERREKYLNTFSERDLLWAALAPREGRLGLRNTKVAPWGKGHEKDLLAIICHCQNPDPELQLVIEKIKTEPKFDTKPTPKN